MSFPATKDPAATLDYLIDWVKDFKGAPIISVEWILPVGIIMEASVFTDTTTTIWVSGGVLGQTYLIVCRASTDALTDERTILLTIVNK
jgi:hypothetical protein